MAFEKREKMLSESLIRKNAASLIITAAVVIVTAWPVQAATASQARGAPAISVDEAAFDFGVLYQGSSVEHEFVIRNQGDDTLRIDNVRSSCGCTVAILDEKLLAPGGQTKLKAKFNSARYRGKVSKNVFVYSNDPEKPITKLKVLGEVKVDMVVSPAIIYFSGLRVGDSVARKVNLQNVSDSTVVIKEISSTVPALRIDLRQMKIPPGKTAVLRLLVDKVDIDTKLNGVLSIRNTSHQDNIRIRLYGGTIKEAEKSSGR